MVFANCFEARDNTSIAYRRNEKLTVWYNKCEEIYIAHEYM